MAQFNISPRELLNISNGYTIRYNIDVGYKPKLSLIIDDKLSPQILRNLGRTRVIFNNRVRTELIAALDTAIGLSIWPTDNGIGDIIDSGELMRSLDVSIQESVINIEYTADYANLVHYGGYIAPYGNESVDKVYIPPRPWVDVVLRSGVPGSDAFDFQGIYRKVLREVFNI